MAIMDNPYGALAFLDRAPGISRTPAAPELGGRSAPEAGDEELDHQRACPDAKPRRTECSTEDGDHGYQKCWDDRDCEVQRGPRSSVSAQVAVTHPSM